MDALTKYALSIYLCKTAEEHIQQGKPVSIKKWDSIKGVPSTVSNTTVTDSENPTSLPTDIGLNNKQLISGTGSGCVLNGKYRSS